MNRTLPPSPQTHLSWCGENHLCFLVDYPDLVTFILQESSSWGEHPTTRESNDLIWMADKEFGTCKRNILKIPHPKSGQRNATQLRQFTHHLAMLKHGNKMDKLTAETCVWHGQSIMKGYPHEVGQYCISHDWDLSLQQSLPYVSILELVRWTLAASSESDKDPCTSRCYQLIFRILGHPSKYVAISANCLRFLRFVKSPEFGPINPGMYKTM